MSSLASASRICVLVGSAPATDRKRPSSSIAPKRTGKSDCFVVGNVPSPGIVTVIVGSVANGVHVSSLGLKASVSG
jgi:hypothetical protein